MPLSAVLNNKPIYGFNFSPKEWSELKEMYRGQELSMSCCGNKARPKTSKLGTQFFSHVRRGECDSVAESEDHLTLKNMVAKVAIEAGWDVTSEYRGETPDGEKWVADVHCRKDTKEMVFEIQWSPQSYEEYERRTQKYLSSGIQRCAWLCRDYKYKENAFPETFETPCFGISGKSGKYMVSKFDVDVETFLKGMFNRKLKWLPVKGQKLVCYAFYNTSLCTRCGGQNNYFCSLHVYSPEGHRLAEELYFNYGTSTQELIEANVTTEQLLQHQIGSFHHIYDKRAGYAFMAHGCLHCNGIKCNHTYRYDYHSDKSRAVRFEATYDPELLYISPKWFFTKRMDNID
ncbi:hypothetical protein BC455_08480 [Vibrio harveyi]|uniref:competence protein CoiA family protein n=1 Tax=Vibrio harveyi TaxID=669 RepID=UPI000842243A|nr:hypothetical protein [Vibrio harveyi]ODM51267.1 hypothetical protein BC455_08480 [Vibrio harveyi]